MERWNEGNSAESRWEGMLPVPLFLKRGDDAVKSGGGAKPGELIPGQDRVSETRERETWRGGERRGEGKKKELGGDENQENRRARMSLNSIKIRSDLDCDGVF